MTQKLDDEGEEDPIEIRADTYLVTPCKMLYHQISVKAVVTTS